MKNKHEHSTVSVFPSPYTYICDSLDDEVLDAPQNEASEETYNDISYVLASGSLSDNDRDIVSYSTNKV